MTNSIMIIGAGQGIGQAVAEKFGREGWHVVLTARNADRLAGLSRSLSEQGLRVTCTATTMIRRFGFSMKTGDRAPISMRISSNLTPKPSWRAFQNCRPARWN